MAANNLGRATGEIEVNTSGLKNADIALRSAGTSMIRLGELAVGAFADIVGTTAKFEKEMDFVQAVTNASAEDMTKLSDAAIALGKNSVFGPIELSKAFVDLAKAGASVQDIIDGVGQASVNLATAADVPIPFAGENLINILNTFKLGAKDATSVADLLAGAANASSVELSDLVISMKYAGPVAQGLGISIEDVNTALTVLGKVGIKGSTAGTSLRAIMLRLGSDIPKVTGTLKELGIITEDGKNQFFDAAGNAKSLDQVFQILQDHTKGLTSQEKTLALSNIFGQRAIPAALELMSQGEAGFASLNDEINRTTAADVAAKRMDNLSGSVRKLKATIESIKTEVGGPFQTMLKGWVDGLRNLLIWFDNLPGPIKTLLVGALGLVGVMALLAGAFLLTIGNIVRAIRVFGEITNAFRAITLASRAATTANEAAGASFLLNPVVLFVAAIVALAAAFYLLYTRVKGFHDFIDGLWQDIQAGWDGVTQGAENFGNKVGEVFDKFTGFFSGASHAWEGFVEAFKGEGITTSARKLVGVTERIGVAFRGAYLAVRHFVTDGLGKIGNVAGTVGTFFSNIVGTIAGFFSRLPRVIAGALVNAGSAVVSFLAGLPEKIAYWLGFAIGRWIGFWYYDLPKAVLQGSLKVFKAVGNFIGKIPDTIYRFLSSALTIAITWGRDFFNTIVNALQALPGQVGRLLGSIVELITSNIAAFASGSLSLGLAIWDGIVGFIAQIPGAVTGFFLDVLNFIVNSVGSFQAAAISLGLSVYNGLIDFFVNLPGEVLRWLTDVGNTIESFAGTFFDKAKKIATSLWNGFKDGLFGSPHTKIEYAMWDMEVNMKRSLDSVRKNIGTLQGLQNRIPQLNAGLVGLPTPAAAAVTSNGGGNVWQQTGPLVGQAVIRDDRDIVSLARQLETERLRQQRARGKAS